MAKSIQGQVLGGEVKTNMEGRTAKDIAEALGVSENHTVTINGSPAKMDTVLADYQFVSFAPAAKGAI